MSTNLPAPNYFQHHLKNGMTLRAAWHDADPQQPFAGTVVLLHGRGGFIESYLETTVGAFQERGWRVLSFDWPGQGLSQRYLPDAHKSHVPTFDSYVEAMGEVMDTYLSSTAQSGPVLLHANSMGAAVTTGFLYARPDWAQKICGVVLESPMLSIKTVPGAVGEWIVRKLVYAGRAHAYAPTQGRYDLEQVSAQNNILTTDQERFKRWLALKKKNPALVIGGVTNGWLYAALEFTAKLRGLSLEGPPKAKGIIITASNDSLVRVDTQTQFAQRFGWAQHFIQCKHEINLADDAAQKLRWQFIDQFIASLPRPPKPNSGFNQNPSP